MYEIAKLYKIHELFCLPGHLEQLLLTHVAITVLTQSLPADPLALWTVWVSGNVLLGLVSKTAALPIKETATVLHTVQL